MRPRFILSTGRCGSTLVGALLGDHPDVAVMSECRAAIQPGAFDRKQLSGADVWALLTEPRRDWTVALQHALEPAEFRYRFSEGARYCRQRGVAPIAAVCLPTLDPDPDRLLDELELELRARRAAPAGEQYRAVFETLASMQAPGSSAQAARSPTRRR